MAEALKGKEGLNEQERLRNETTRGLSNLRQDVVQTNKEKTKEQKEEEKIQACINHLRLVIDERYYKDVMEKNTEATIKSVQYLLKNFGYDCGEIDGILVTKGKKISRTMEAIKRFQKDNGLKVDGILGKETIKKLLKVYDDIYNYKRKKYLEINHLPRLTDKDIDKIKEGDDYPLSLPLRVKSITDKQAKSLSKSVDLHLNGLTNITDVQAEYLSKLEELELKGLTSLSDKQAELLGQGKLVYLDLSGLKSITDKQAESLSKVKNFYLNGLKSITDKQAESLSNVKNLYLNGLKSITDKQAESLSKVKNLHLTGLKSITDKQFKLLSKTGYLYIGGKTLTDKQLIYLVENCIPVGGKSKVIVDIDSLTYKEKESLLRKVGNLLVKRKIITQKEMEQKMKELLLESKNK